MARSEAGFQLVELLVVVAVVGLGALVAVPPLVRAAGGIEVRLAAEEVVAAFR